MLYPVFGCFFSVFIGVGVLAYSITGMSNYILREKIAVSHLGSYKGIIVADKLFILIGKSIICFTRFGDGFVRLSCNLSDSVNLVDYTTDCCMFLSKGSVKGVELFKIVDHKVRISRNCRIVCLFYRYDISVSRSIAESVDKALNTGLLVGTGIFCSLVHYGNAFEIKACAERNAAVVVHLRKGDLLDPGHVDIAKTGISHIAVLKRPSLPLGRGGESEVITIITVAVCTVAEIHLEVILLVGLNRIHTVDNFKNRHTCHVHLFAQGEKYAAVKYAGI